VTTGRSSSRRTAGSRSTGHEGIVEIWDEKGSGKDPVRDTDDRFEVVKKGDAWLIREFPRTIPERGAKSLIAVGERR